jgi:hypothetical protein
MATVCSPKFLAEQAMTDEAKEPLSKLFLKRAGRHFVTLSCVQMIDGSKEKVLVFSGFVAQARGEWFYVTAGHIIRDIRLAMEAGAKFDVWRFGDQTAGHRFGDAGIPLDFDHAPWLVLNDDENGLDYAVMHIDGLYRQQLEVGGVVPIGNNSWGTHLDEHDHWALVGIPAESVAYDARTMIGARFVVIPVETVGEPAGAGDKAKNQFYARLKDESPRKIEDIDGMSGGPIFAMKKECADMYYSVIGVQSGWYRESRVIAACPFSSLGKALEAIIDEARADQPPPGEGK